MSNLSEPRFRLHLNDLIFAGKLEMVLGFVAAALNWSSKNTCRIVIVI